MSELPRCVFERIHEEAVEPSKAHPSDVGYDLTVIGLKKMVGPVALCRTGLKIRPPAGWTFDIGPRSSIVKSGYLLGNSTGYIDPHYRGEFLVALWQFDPQAPALEFPAKLVQLIPRKLAPNFQFEEGSVDVDTDRGESSFGGTDNKKS